MVSVINEIPSDSTVQVIPLSVPSINLRIDWYYWTLGRTSPEISCAVKKKKKLVNHGEIVNNLYDHKPSYTTVDLSTNQLPVCLMDCQYLVLKLIYK